MCKWPAVGSSPRSGGRSAGRCRGARRSPGTAPFQDANAPPRRAVLRRTGDDRRTPSLEGGCDRSGRRVVGRGLSSMTSRAARAPSRNGGGGSTGGGMEETGSAFVIIDPEVALPGMLLRGLRKEATAVRTDRLAAVVGEQEHLALVPMWKARPARAHGVRRDTGPHAVGKGGSIRQRRGGARGR